MTLTAAFMTDAMSLASKGATAVTFQAPQTAIEVLSAKPAKLKALIRGYGEAIAKSRKDGRTVSFRVEVDPSGVAKVTPIEPVTTAPGPPEPESVDSLNAALE